MISDSTYKFVQSTLARQTRGRLLRRRTALYCPTHQQIERVTDKYPNGECKLSCGCRRLVVTDVAAVERFEIEQQRRNEESAA